MLTFVPIFVNGRNVGCYVEVYEQVLITDHSIKIKIQFINRIFKINQL